jgi:hypothetical protein
MYEYAREVYLSTGWSCTQHCISLTYAAPSWAPLHPIWAKLHSKSYAAPSELSCTLLSSAAPFWAVLHPTELHLTQNEQRGTLKKNFPRPSQLSWARICKHLLEPRNRFPAWGPMRQPYLTYRPARLHRLAESIPGLHNTNSLKIRTQILTAILLIRRENPAKIPVLGKNPLKYTTAYTVQQSNCRWDCEPVCLLAWA